MKVRQVQWWVSLNEPRSIRIGYGGTYYAPALNDSGVSDYLASHNLLIAHAKVYHLYNDTYKTSQQGKRYYIYRVIFSKVTSTDI